MTTAYSHSIRNRLFLVLGANDLEYAVTNNDGLLLTFGRSAVTDKDMLLDVLTNTSPLSEIFSSVDLTWSNSDFVTFPQAFTNAEDQRKLFSVNFKRRPENRLITNTINSDIAVIYAANSELLKVVKDKYPNVTYHHEIESLFNYAHTEIKDSGESIVISNSETHSLVLVRSNQQLKLINQYDTNNLDDLFYFTMLAVEQLELDIEHLSLYWSDSSQSKPFEDIVALYKPYIKHINAASMNKRISTALHTAILCA